MSTHNICFCGEIRKILCGYPLLSVAMNLTIIHGIQSHSIDQYISNNQPYDFMIMM